MFMIHKYSIRPTVALLLSIMVVGCVSNSKRFERATNLEDEGRFEEAAAYYIEVLERDDTWDDARVRLADVGKRATDQLMAEAQSLESQGRYEATAEVLERLDTLHRGAAGVGVTLVLRSDYATYRQRIMEGAIAEAVAAGEEAASRGQWPEALAHYERAQERYPMNAARTDDLKRARADVLVQWAEEDLDDDAHRAAWGRAQQAIDLVGEVIPAAATLQEEALRLGTRQVVFVPFWRLDAWMRSAPASILDDLNDVLNYDFWMDPPLFIATADPVEVRRELRRMRYNRQSLDRNQAAEVGRIFDADFVVVGEGVAYVVEEKLHKEETKKARTRGRNAVDTTYVVEDVELKLRADVAYQVVDPASRRMLDERTVSENIVLRFERGRYAGNPDDLDLRANDRRLFDTAEHEDRRHDLEVQLTNVLAAKVAQEVYDDLLRRIR